MENSPVSRACGVAVENSTGAVYVSEPGQKISRYLPTSAPGPGLSNANFSVTSIKVEGLAASWRRTTQGMCTPRTSTGHQAVSDASEFDASRPARKASKSRRHEPPIPTPIRRPTSCTSTPEAKSLIFDLGRRKCKEFGEGSFSSCGGIAVNGGEGPGQAALAHHAYAVNGAKSSSSASSRIPTNRSKSRRSSMRWRITTPTTGRLPDLAERPLRPLHDQADDAQPELRQRRVPDDLPLRLETEGIDCVTCIPTEARPSADAALPSRGLGIANDGTRLLQLDRPARPARHQPEARRVRVGSRRDPASAAVTSMPAARR